MIVYNLQVLFGNSITRSGLPSFLPPLHHLVTPVLVILPVLLLALLAAVLGFHASFAHEKILCGVAVCILGQYRIELCILNLI